MILPPLTERTKGYRKNRDYNIDFKGYCHKLYVNENEFYDTGNLCATHYPVMSPRAQRATVRTLTNPQGIYAWGKLCWCADNKFYYDGTQYGTVTSGQKQMVGMGAWVLIFPDAVRFHTVNHTFESLAAGWTAASNASIAVTLCRMDGEDYSNVTASDAAPSSPSNGAYWLDTSLTPHTLKVYSGGAWVAISTTYLRIYCASNGTDGAKIGANFAVGDVVSIGGFTGTHTDLNADYSIIGISSDKKSLIVIGVIDASFSQTGGVTVGRSIPSMDFVCELNNRIWGCSSANHEIYACKLGDPTNWRSYDGLAGDSYAVTVGSKGDFTGCVSFGGQVLFFKEDMLHKIMGDKPSNFQLIDSPIRGVQKGSEKSICIVNESLLYKARDHVVVYDGGTPMTVSDNLGPINYKNAAAGCNGDRYYISMQDDAGVWTMFVFDEAKGFWYREDSTHASQFAALDGQLYYIDAATSKQMAVRGAQETGATLEGAVSWYAETGDMLVTSPDNKYVSRIQIRCHVEENSTLAVAAKYDNGDWVTIFTKTYTQKGSFTMPIIPRRCDHFRLKISGTGRSCVYGLSKEIEQGSEL